MFIIVNVIICIIISLFCVLQLVVVFRFYYCCNFVELFSWRPISSLFFFCNNKMSCLYAHSTFFRIMACKYSCAHLSTVTDIPISTVLSSTDVSRILTYLWQNEVIICFCRIFLVLIVSIVDHRYGFASKENVWK